jgi:squalene synthase HpnC
MSVVRGVPPELRPAYARCGWLAARHYENFTVASRLVPGALRPHLWALYAYCRGVDDLGDEHGGDRLQALAEWEQELRRCYAGGPRRPEFRALEHTIRRFDLPAEPFLALIEANRRDQDPRPYETFAELRGYCACSADPVGRLVLALWGFRDARRQSLSDDVCTALQLTNFWQDLGADLARGRLYVPLEDLRRFDLSVDDLLRRKADGRVRALLAFEVERTRRLFERGSALEALVSPRLRLQLRLYRLGGEAVLAALEGQGFDPFRRRPALGRGAKAAVGLGALLGWPSRARPAVGAPVGVPPE